MSWCAECGNGAVSNHGDVCFLCKAASSPEKEVIDRHMNMIIDNARMSIKPMYMVDGSVRCCDNGDMDEKHVCIKNKK